ncbi:MAG: hypothetical protein QOG70_1116 [Solirubrobacteraceae bacterium]|jgi:hypothetical protein|nr:hypothetical protein [Solirubrobacteraceae bacterium]
MRFTQQREHDRLPFGSADARPSPPIAPMLDRVLERLAGLEDQVAALAARLEPPVAQAEPEVAEPEVAEPEPVPEAAAIASNGPSGAVPDSRWREAVAGVLHRPRARCAVCQSDAPLRSRGELVRAGWTVTGRWGVCPTCRSEAWHLSHDGGLPFRVRATNGSV